MTANAYDIALCDLFKETLHAVVCHAAYNQSVVAVPGFTVVEIHQE